jgi:ArsR family transcriptional regulator
MFISAIAGAEGEDGPRWSVEATVAALRAAGEPTRLRALALLAQGELSVGELADALGQSQPRVSRHLRLLTESGVADRAPEGAWVFYRLPEAGRPERVLVERILAQLSPDDPFLAQDRERLARIRAARDAAAAAYFERVAPDWSRLRALHLPDAEIEAAILAAAGPGPFGLMVDIGVGAGRMIALFAERCARAIGVDKSREMLALARADLAELAAGKVELRYGDAYAPPAPAGGADLVTLHQVLHFLADPARAVAEAVKLLRPGGRLVIADFDRHDLESLRTDHAHRRLGFTDAEIAAWCDAAGAGPLTTTTLAPSRRDGDRLTVKIWACNRAAPPATGDVR